MTLIHLILLTTGKLQYGYLSNIPYQIITLSLRDKDLIPGYNFGYSLAKFWYVAPFGPSNTHCVRFLSDTF